MDTTKAHITSTGGWVLGLALLSLVLPLAGVVLRGAPAAPLADPANVNYYRQTVAALVLGLAGAIGTFAMSRGVAPAKMRQASIVLASLGLLVGGYLLLALIGSCGVGVLAGVCQP